MNRIRPYHRCSSFTTTWSGSESATKLPSTQPTPFATSAGVAGRIAPVVSITIASPVASAWWSLPTVAEAVPARTRTTVGIAESARNSMVASIALMEAFPTRRSKLSFLPGATFKEPVPTTRIGADVLVEASRDDDMRISTQARGRSIIEREIGRALRFRNVGDRGLGIAQLLVGVQGCTGRVEAPDADNDENGDGEAAECWTHPGIFLRHRGRHVGGVQVTRRTELALISGRYGGGRHAVTLAVGEKDSTKRPKDGLRSPLA